MMFNTALSVVGNVLLLFLILGLVRRVPRANASRLRRISFSSSLARMPASDSAFLLTWSPRPPSTTGCASGRPRVQAAGPQAR